MVDIAIAEIAGEGPQPHQIDLELLQTHVGRDVERIESLIVDDAGRPQSVPGLKSLDRRLDIGIEDLRAADGRVEIAAGGQAATQIDDGAPLRAEFQRLAGRHLVPSARVDDLLIAPDRIFGRCDGLRRQDRCRRARHGQAGIGIIFLDPFGLAAENRVGTGARSSKRLS